MPRVALVYNLKRTKGKDKPDDYFSEFDAQETVEAIAQALRLGGHELFLVEADKNLPDWLKAHPIDIVFNIAEGFWGSGREAQVPAILEFLGIPYTGSSIAALVLSMDKARAKQIFMQQGIPTPNFQLFKKGARPLFAEETELKRKRGQAPLQFPLIVKPNSEGSAKGIHASSVVKTQRRLYEEIARIRQLYRQDVLVEEFIEGRELTVGILGNQTLEVLPILEIDFTNCKAKGESFYSWEVKEYQGIDPSYPDPEFFCPARLSKEQEKGVKKVALEAHQALGCLDVSRVDIRLSSDSIPYVLEVNCLPGLDPKESNFTRMGQAWGLKYSDLINKILENALNRYGLINSSATEALTKER